MPDKQGVASGKLCSVCGVLYPHDEFCYRNRENRSYCRTCDKEVSVAYAKGGTEAAHQYRESRRASWRESGKR